MGMCILMPMGMAMAWIYMRESVEEDISKQAANGKGNQVVEDWVFEWRDSHEYDIETVNEENGDNGYHESGYYGLRHSW